MTTISELVATASRVTPGAAPVANSTATTLPATLPLTAGLVPPGAPTLAPGSPVLTVGVGKQFATLGAAIAASHDGDTILVDAGTYTNDFATITTKLTIVGVGGMVSLVATAAPPNDKGILTVDNDATLMNLTFSGAAIPDSAGGNGAGIRYEGGRMALVNDSFSANQDGILAFPVIAGLTVNTITIDHSVFSDNGSGTGYTHNLYVGAVDKLTVTNSIFQGALVGHEFKSRALINDIEGNIFRDGPSGTASYDIDLPNGGVDLVKNNLIEKGPNAQNNAMVHFGGEGIPYAGSSLLLQSNYFANDKGGSTIALLNQTAISATITGNAFSAIAPGQIVQGPATGTGNSDGAGTPLPNLTQVGVLPGDTTIFTDNIPHSVVLTHSGAAVEGGGGLLSVSAPAGHIIVIGGSGGLKFTEGPTSGGNSISTNAAAVNVLSLVGQDLVDSQGSDTIGVGAGNVTGVISGRASIADGTGNDSWSVTGTAFIVGHGGNPVVALGARGKLQVLGQVGYLAVQDNGGLAKLDVLQGGAEEALSVTGGAASISVFNAAMNITTAAGAQGVALHLGVGAAYVKSLGADSIWAGAGAASIIVSGRATIYAGTGTLSVFGHGDGLGATLFGNGGDYTLGGDTGNITYYGGAAASTIEARLSNNTLIGGAGRLSIHGGTRERIIGGAGGITYAASDGGGANAITTATGAQDWLTLAGADVLDSWGRDVISGGSGNQTMTLHGDATITGSTGNSTLTFFGNDSLVGRGQDTCTLNAGANVAITAGTNSFVTETAAALRFVVASGANAVSLGVTGGAASVIGGTQSSTVVTTGQGAATGLTLDQGAASLSLNGADTATVNAGSATITVNAANSCIFGGAGMLSVHDYDPTTGDGVTIHGGSGALTYDQGGAALTFIGGAGSAVIDGAWGSLAVTGGAGAVTVAGGQAGLRFVGGTGLASIALTPSGGDVTFGQGATAVQVASYGAANRFHCDAGAGGGSATITGFRNGVDQVLLQGVAVAAEAVLGGATLITLTDHTQLRLVGLTDPSDIFGGTGP